jgi:hypothetical protein
LGENNLFLLKSIVKGLDFEESGKLEPCVACFKGKQTRLFFKSTGNSRAREMLELVHSGVCGPMKESIGGATYFGTFIDDKSRKCFVYMIKSKSEVIDMFKYFKNYAENETGKRVKAIRTDNGSEYLNNTFRNFLKENGIRHQLNVEYNPKINGVAEKANRTIVEKARTMLQETSLKPSYWAEAVNTAVYLINRSPTKALKGMVPEEAWTGRTVSLRHLRVFESRAFAHIPKEKRKKWDPKSKETIMVGYCEYSKAYRLIDPRNPPKVQRERNVRFIGDHRCITRDQELTFLEEEQQENTVDPMSEPQTTTVEIDSIEDNVNLERKDSNDEVNTQAETNNEVFTERRYPLRDRKAQKFPGSVSYFSSVDNSNDPLTTR